MKIGVFDSGLGGLTVLKSLLEKLPEYRYVYLGDSARVPYGNRSPEIIYQFSKEAIRFLFGKNCQIIIIACNTVSAVALRQLQQDYISKYFPGKKVLGVIKPAVESIGGAGKIGVIGTKSTVNSGAFVREIKKIYPSAEVFQQACPLLVPFIEDWSEKNSRALDLILRNYLKPLQDEKVATLILACTHYGHIRGMIKKIMGDDVKIISENEITAEKLKDYLHRHPEIRNKLTLTDGRKPPVEFFVTDFSPDYEKLIRLFLGKIWNETPVSLAEL